ncbi:hypothetical protein [Clostridium sp.]|uniref:hypothetical protein n=1 Tax=Clostridium sp. TaxID=1506 RepID=UPI003994C328
MCNYRMEIKGNIGLSDYSNIYDYISIVESSDEFTIIIDSSNEENIRIVCSMLKDKNFSINSKRIEDNGVYKIKASKNA